MIWFNGNWVVSPLTPIYFKMTTPFPPPHFGRHLSGPKYTGYQRGIPLQFLSMRTVFAGVGVGPETQKSTVNTLWRSLSWTFLPVSAGNFQRAN